MKLPATKISPINLGTNIRKIDSFPVEEVIKLYQSIHIDVNDYFKNISEIELLECVDSKYRFYYPFHIFGDEYFYESLKKINKTYYKLRWEHQYAAKRIDATSNVLEIGCGNGLFLESLQHEHSSNRELHGLELTEESAIEARQRGIKAFHTLIENHAKDFPEYYDTVCCFQVLEHVSNVKDFLDAALSALKPGGKLIIGVPNNNPYLFKHDRLHTLNLPPHHAGLWNKNSLVSLTKFFPVKVIDVAIEPLFEIKYYWTVQKKYWENTNKFIFKTINLIPQKYISYIHRRFKKIFAGRNIVIVFEKEKTTS